MIGAVIIDNIVDNIIVMDVSQIEELSQALGAEIVDAGPYGLMIGDSRSEDGQWMRNAGGDNLILPLLTPEQYDSVTLAMRRAVEAEKALEQAHVQIETMRVALTDAQARATKSEALADRNAASSTGTNEKEVI